MAIDVNQYILHNQGSQPGLHISYHF